MQLYVGKKLRLQLVKVCNLRNCFFVWFIALARVNSDAQLEEFLGLVGNLEAFDFGEQMERHGGDFARVFFVVADRQAADHHVRVADRLHLVDVVVRDDVVKVNVQVVQQLHHLDTIRASIYTAAFTKSREGNINILIQEGREIES